MPATARRSAYETTIRESLARLGFIGMYDPREVEAWMRLECGTLDGLSVARFHLEVAAACDCINAAPRADSRALAESYGL